jgi:hypothetical protein
MAPAAMEKRLAGINLNWGVSKIQPVIEQNFTTETLLRLEDAGGVISNGVLPKGLHWNDSLDVWFTKFPAVTPNLVAKWYTFYQAKRELDAQIKRLTK